MEVVDKKEWLALLNNKVPKDDMSSLEKEYWNDVIDVSRKEKNISQTKILNYEKRECLANCE